MIVTTAGVWAGVALVLGAAGGAAAPQPEYLYRLEFDKGRAPGWRFQKTSTWAFDHGTLVQENTGPKHTAIWGLGHPSWHDFEIRMRVRFITPRIEAKRNTVFAVNVWNVRADVLPGRASLWYRRPGETKYRAVHKHDKGLVIDPEHWYDIRIRYQASRVTVTMDGELIAALTDVPPRPTSGAPLTVYFSNLKCALDYFRVVDMEAAGTPGATVGGGKR